MTECGHVKKRQLDIIKQQLFTAGELILAEGLFLMRRVALIVEGKGDVKAFPSLVAKAAAAFEIQLFPSGPPIRASEAKKLKRPGELERYLWLAASRDEAEEILLIVDLDDGCAKDFAVEFNQRAANVSKVTGKDFTYVLLYVSTRYGFCQIS